MEAGVTIEEKSAFVAEESLREEIFFFLYHGICASKKDVLEFVPEERKWMMSRFTEQKKRENEEIEKARAKAKQQSKSQSK